MPESTQTPAQTPAQTQGVSNWLEDLQNAVCDRLRAVDQQISFAEDLWSRPGGGGGNTRILSDGAIFEKAGVNFSHIYGDKLPVAATETRPEIAGKPFEALGVSIVAHPANPYVPIAHCNVRFFSAASEDAEPNWWFGGGYDLTPCYPFMEDVVAWHRAAQAVCQPFGDAVYPRFKQQCDEYFFLKHRNETRGVGGLFFDDLNEWGFERCFAFAQSLGNSFVAAYADLVKRRAQTPFGDRERQFQLYRRGRYVEFNLIYDRGTLFGLQSAGRTESILMSLPPCANWRYNWTPEPGSPEHDLYLNYLKPRDWLAEV